MKATYGEVNGKGRAIFKNPKTDDGTKKSAKGLISLENRHGEFKMKDMATKEEEESGLLQTVYKDGKLCKEVSLTEIRHHLNQQIEN